MDPAIHARFELARAVALEAGALAVKMRAEKSPDFASRKSHQDFVTAADLAVEDLIRRRILEQFPQDSILGEEQGASGESDSVWVVDPIDGTTNYMHGMPEWAVSIGYCRNQSILCAAVYAPDISTLVSAQAGCGTQVADTPVKVSSCDHAESALVLLGRSARHGGEDYLNHISGLIDAGMEYRRNGSAAYSLLAVAAGRAEAFYEAHLNAWDAIAGILLVNEAGGRVEYPPFPEFLTAGGPVFASNAILHDEINAATFGIKRS